MIRALTIRLFQRVLLAWVIGFVVSAYGGLDRFNVLCVSPPYMPPGPLAYVTHALAMLPGGVSVLVVLAAIPLLLVLCVRDLFVAQRWWSAVLIWLIYVNLMNRAWLAGSGGQQLIANLLFWNIFLSQRKHDQIVTGAFWILRMQVVLAYLATGLNKVTGTHWMDGTALGIVATDPAFGPAWMEAVPAVAAVLTWSVLIFQLSFPIALWFRPIKHVWMLFGILFHLGTALWMDIPEMGLAFIASYAIWLDDALIGRWRLAVPERFRPAAWKR